jgi:hypothetical protein
MVDRSGLLGFALVREMHLLWGDWLGACGLGLSRRMLLLLIGCMHRRPGLAPQVQKAPLSLALQLRGKRAYPLGLAGLSSRAARDQSGGCGANLLSGGCGANLLSGATNHLLVLTMPQKFREPNSKQCMAPAWPSRFRFARAMQAEGSEGCVCVGGSRRPCARGVQPAMFATLVRERAWFPRAKNDAVAWP